MSKTKTKISKGSANSGVGAKSRKRKATRPEGDYYPEIEPFCTGFLDVTDGHKIYFEESGNPNGKPVVFLHGGPGGGTSPSYRRFFNPDVYRIIIFDQRGCGKSTPFASLENNTTWDLVADIEALREHFGIEKWMVFGGSWGSTLSLAYAEAHPERVTELVLRGIFLGRKLELDWFYQQGASFVFPEYWQDYYNHIPARERGNMMQAYYKRLTSKDPAVRLAAAKVWSVWEGCASKLHIDKDLMARNSGEEFATAFARIECHYFVNGCFFRSDSQLLDDVSRIRHIPCTIVQGRYDMVCPATSAHDLHQAFPEAELVIVPDAGHSMSEPGIKAALLEACDKYATTAKVAKKK
ncbi:MAG: prolyl aminopeptidase [Cyanobacteria bacterium SZAS LIN-3]|nr:prolyl aminopeptidase [Cyanobacteria bacterium SZAS LIN-3]